VPADGDGAQHLVLEHRHRERGGGQVGDRPGDHVVEVLTHPAGQVVVEQPQHDPQVITPHRPGLHRRFQVDDVVARRRDQRDRAVHAGPAQYPLARRVADHHGQPQVASDRNAASRRVLVDEDDVEPEVVQAAGHPGADVAAADHDHVPAARPRLTADPPGQPGPDDDRGHQREQRHPVGGEQDLRDLLRAGVSRAGERGPGHVHDPQVEHVTRRVARCRQEDEAGQGGRDENPEDDPELVPQQPPGHPEHAAHRVTLPGQRVPRRAVGHRQYQVGAAVQVFRRDELRGAVRVVGDREPAQHPPADPVVAPGDVQGAPGEPDVTRRDLAEGGGDERGRGELAAGQHRAVAEEPGDVITEPPVVGGDDEPEVGAELLCAQRRVEVGEVIGAHQGHRPGRGDVRVRECLAGQPGVLADGDAGKHGDLRAVVAELVGEDHDDVLLVAPRELPGDAVGERVVTADDEVTPGQGGRWHDRIILKTTFSRPGLGHPAIRGRPEKWFPG
jgi:hypothetical protein